MSRRRQLVEVARWALAVGLLAAGSLLWPVGEGAPNDDERRAAQVCASVPPGERVACTARVLEQR